MSSVCRMPDREILVECKSVCSKAHSCNDHLAAFYMKTVSTSLDNERQVRETLSLLMRWKRCKESYCVSLHICQAQRL